MVRIQISLLILCSLVFAWFILLIRKGKLREKYIALWTAALVLSISGIVFYKELIVISEQLGFTLLSNLIILCLILFSIIQDLYHSVELTKCESRLESSALKIAELEMRLNILESRK